MKLFVVALSLVICSSSFASDEFRRSLFILAPNFELGSLYDLFKSSPSEVQAKVPQITNISLQTQAYENAFVAWNATAVTYQLQPSDNVSCTLSLYFKDRNNPENVKMRLHAGLVHQENLENSQIQINLSDLNGGRLLSPSYLTRFGKSAMTCNRTDGQKFTDKNFRKAISPLFTVLNSCHDGLIDYLSCGLLN